MAFSDLMLVAYSRAKERRPDLRKGQFMQEVFTGKYKNEASARRQFNKVITSETSGKRLELQRKKEDRRVGPVGSSRTRKGGGEWGLWKVNITFYFVDSKGSINYKENEEPYPITRSFVAVSETYGSIVDRPVVTSILQEAIDEHIEEWTTHAEEEDGNYPILGWADYSIEIFPIERTDLPQEQIVDMTAIELGGESPYFNDDDDY